MLLNLAKGCMLVLKGGKFPMQGDKVGDSCQSNGGKQRRLQW